MVTNTYELMFILNPELAEDAQESYLQRVRNYLEESEAIVYSFKEWGLRRLAYTIQGHHEGRYYLVYFAMETQKLAQFEHNLQLLSEGILRELITRPPDDFVPEVIEEPVEVAPPPPPPPPAEAVVTEDETESDTAVVEATPPEE